MSHNDLYPLWMELKYAVGTKLHVQRIPLKPATPFTTQPGEPATSYLLEDHNGDNISFDAFVEDYTPFLQPFFSSGVNFTIADLWYKATVDSDPVWLTQKEVGISGTAVASTQSSGQLVLSNRTQEGGKFMLYLMESVYGPNLKDDFPFGTPNWANLGNYLKSVVCPITGRDGAFIAANIRVTTKTNDALRKRNLLDA